MKPSLPPSSAPSFPPPLSGRRRLLAAALCLPAGTALAGILDLAPTAGSDTGHFLPVAEAFRVRWTWSDAGYASGEFAIAPGYYLYRDRLHVQLKTPAGGQLAALELPDGEVKEDPYAGRQVVYHHSFVAKLPIALPAGHGGAVELEVVWQGCADAGLCYPPVRRTFSLRS